MLRVRTQNKKRLLEFNTAEGEVCFHKRRISPSRDLKPPHFYATGWLICTSASWAVAVVEIARFCGWGHILHR
jgi:hypothetical protein